MDNKKNFRLNENARNRINGEYLDPNKQAKVRRRPQIPSPPPQYYEPVYDTPPQEEYIPEQKPPKKRKVRKFITVTVLLCAAVMLINLGALLFTGKIWFNEPRKRDYPVRGAVVDQSLGTVDWKKMSQQTISFAYIRATKGSAVVDKEFSDNRKGAVKTDLLVGFYHEFDFSADGENQAKNYIDTCGDLDGRLRPVVKVSRYGLYRIHMKEAINVVPRLEAFLDAIREEYGRSAVIMCDEACYREYIEGNFDDNTLWIIDHFSEPDEELDWALWEYNPRVRAACYQNKKEYYSMTVYRKEKSLANFKKHFLI
ncbi:MAG: glycoside hydrolase family 25 protein [Oscillospiraceae bacterium]